MLILILAIILSLCVGLIAGGAISNLSRIRLRFIPFVFLAFFIQVLIFSPILGYNPIVHRIGPYIHLATLIIPLCVMLMNLHVPGMKVIIAGAALNLLVITVNGGFMPISESALRISGQEEELQQHQPRHDSEDYVFSNTHLSGGNAKLIFLGDVIPIPKESPIVGVISIGDVVLAAGASIAIVRGMRTRNSEDETTLILNNSNA